MSLKQIIPVDFAGGPYDGFICGLSVELLEGETSPALVPLHSPTDSNRLYVYQAEQLYRGGEYMHFEFIGPTAPFDESADDELMWGPYELQSLGSDGWTTEIIFPNLAEPAQHVELHGPHYRVLCGNQVAYEWKLET